MVEVEVPLWLRGLPLAPEYHPSETEFLDPIAYILTIEQEASKFGICKIVPPFVKASKRAVVNNLNMSLSRSHEAVTKTAEGLSPPMARSIGSARTITATVAKSGGLDMEDGWKPKFTTRWQQLGCNSRKSRAFPQFVSQKSVWQSGESYTLDQFEAKAKIFSRNRLGTSKEVAPLSVEALFWKAESEKAISIEYANDIPGSAFGRGTSECTVMTSCKKRKRKRCVDSEEASEEGLGQVEEDKVNMSEEKDETGKEGEYPRGLGLEPNSQTRYSDGCKLSNSAWNMRHVARSPGSLLQFMPNEVPGVTSPMVYIAMLFSWFAWHVEDHELHSLNYLHMGASKTWYAVPGEAATALEEVVQVYGYGGELNSRDAFARLGEKTTLMSPEILVTAGVPCCRLVQNAGEYVVTFPRAYHLGFSHGFNCGEAANFATPVWLDLAREAAARRAAMNYLPMLSHQQLLYLLAMSIASRPPLSSPTEVRTSCLKEKKRIGEEIVKTVFVNDVISHNSLLGKLIDHGVTSCILLSDVCNVTLPAPSLMHSNVIVGCTSMHDFSSKLDPEDHFRTMCPEKKVDPLVEGDRGAIQGAPSCLHDAIVTTPYLDSAASSSGECLDCQDWDGGCSTFQDEVHSPRKDIAENNPVATTSPFDWGTLPCAVCGILCYAGLAVVQPSQAAASVFKSWQAPKAGNHPENVVNKQNLQAAMSPESDTKLDDLLPSLGCKPLLEFNQGKTPHETAPVNCQEQSVEGGILTPQVPEKELFTGDCNNQCWSLAMTPNVEGEAFFNQVEVADASFRSSTASTHHEQKEGVVLSDKDAPRESRSNLKEFDGQNVLCTSHWDASEAVLSVVPVEGQSLGKDVGSAAPQYKLSVSTPSISVGIMERLADDIWSTGDEFVVCEEQSEFDDSSGAVEVCVSDSDPALSSLQLLTAVYSVNCETEDDCFEEQKVQESTAICQVQTGLGNVHATSIGLPSNSLEGYLLCTLPGADCIGTLNQNTQDTPSIFTSNEPVSVSEALEASQVTMINAVDQNDAFLLGEGLLSSEHSVDSQSKTVGENTMQHGWKDHALDSDCGLEHQEKHMTVDYVVLVNGSKGPPSHSTNFEGLEAVGKCAMEMDTELVQNVPVAAGGNGDTEGLCYPQALDLGCFPGSKAQELICDILPVEPLSIEGPSMEKLEDPAASSMSADGGGRGLHSVSDRSRQAVLQLGECVTCWSTHDDFFYSSDDLTSSSQICPDSDALMSSEEDANCKSFQVSIADDAVSGGGDLAVDTCNTPTFRMGCEAESSTMYINPLDRDSKHAATFSELHRPLTTQNEKNGVNGGEDAIDIALELQTIIRRYRGASTPQVLCLEHAVDAQRQLEALGGSHVLVIFHSSYAETEQLAKQLAAEMGIEHEWRSTAFEKASHNDLSTICAALRAEEDKGYQDWVTQLGLVDHNTINATSSNVDDLDINLGHERIGTPGIKSRVKGKHSKVKKCTVVGQWCGQGLQMDQLPPLLGGCQMLTSQTEVTILPSVSLCGENISTPLEVGRSCKVSQSLELAHHNPEQLDVDFDITKLGRRMETLLGEHSNEESIQWCRGVTHPLGYNSNSGACVIAKDDSGKIPVSGRRTTLRKTKLERRESIKYEAQQALAVWERLGKQKMKDQIATRNLAESSSNYFLQTGENKELETLAPGGVQWHHDSSQSTGGCVVASGAQPSSYADGDMSQMSHNHLSDTINPPGDVPLLPYGEVEAGTVEASADVPCVLLTSLSDVADVTIPLEKAVPFGDVCTVWQTSTVNSNSNTSFLHSREDAIPLEPPVGSYKEEDTWCEVPIAMVDCLPSCLPACEVVADKQEIFHPNDLEEGNKTNDLQPSPNDQLCEVGNCCSVVGDYLQRGAKIQALQRLCRQQSTPVSHSLSMADKFSSLDTFSCNKVSTQKVVLCLKRKSFMGGHQDSGKLKLTGASNGEEHMLSCMYCVNHIPNSSPIWLVDRGDAKKTLRGDDCGPGDGDFVPVRITCDSRQLQCKVMSASNIKGHKWGSVFSCSAGDCAQVFESETLLEAHCSSCHLIPQSPLDNNNLAATFCTESSFQGASGEQERKLLWPPSITGRSLHFDTCVLPRLGRVRGRRTKSLGWKSCIQVSPVRQEGKPSSHMDFQDATYKFSGLKSDACALGVEVGHSMLPHSGGFRGASMRLQRQRPSMTDMECEGSDAHGSPDPGPYKKDGKSEKRRKARKPKAIKQCEEQEREFQCSFDGCCMGFDTKKDLELHMLNRCTWKGCGKHFHLHKYLLQHRRVHLDDRPLKCPWKGCTQSFKWAWARTEHMRVHTGERPYKCTLAGCGLTFRFVSDFSRHKRNTGHKPAS